MDHTAAKDLHLVTSQREDWLDWLRGIAAVAVVEFHINQVRSHDGSWYDRLTSLGWLGVPVFFFVSGYCIQLTVLRRPNWRGFLLRRLIRIYPPYLASLIIVCLVVAWRRLIIGANDVTSLPRTVLDVVCTVTLLIEPITRVPAMNWVYWTLTYELAFYLIVALTILANRFSFIVLFVITVASSVSWLHNVTPLFFLRHRGLFSLGFAMATGLHGPKKHARLLLLASALSIAVDEGGATEVTACLMFVVGALRWTINPSENLGRLNSLRHLGTISYSLYLIHVPIGVYILGRLLDISGAHYFYRTVLTDALIVVGCSFSALLIYYTVERPSIEFGRTHLPR